jgi:hypothetical protein
MWQCFEKVKHILKCSGIEIARKIPRDAKGFKQPSAKSMVHTDDLDSPTT